jgi:hypothetical protein
MIVSRALLTVGALVVASLHALPARAQPSSESTTPAGDSGDASASAQSRAKGLLRYGFAELGLKNYEGARKAFAKAYELDPVPTIALTLAEVEMKLELYQDAADHWLAFLKKASEDNPERPNAHNQLAECRKHLGRAKLTVDTAPAEFFVDARLVGRAPMRDEVWLAPGEHTFTIKTPNGQAAAQTSRIFQGDLTTVDFKIVQARPAPAAPASPGSRESAPPASSDAPATASAPQTDSPAKESGSARTPVLIAGAALTTVALGAGIFFTISANNAASDIEGLQAEVDAASDGSGNACSATAVMRPDACDDLTARVEDHDGARKLAIGSFIGAGVFGAATVATYFLWPTDGEGKKAARLELAPWGKGVQARVSF